MSEKLSEANSVKCEAQVNLCRTQWVKNVCIVMAYSVGV